MAIISEDYCGFETAKLLKEKGMDVSCFNHYVQKNNNDGTSEAVTVCTLQMAMKWLRKVHEIAIVIDCWFGGEYYINWHGKIMCYGDELKTQQDVDMPYVATYEKACEAAIKYCLEHLIK